MPISQNEYALLTACVQKIRPLLTPDSLNLEGQATLIENTRQISLILVDATHQFVLHKDEAVKVNKALLGYILTIPRLEEEPGTDMLARALHQIECINVAALDVQAYLRKHLSELEQYIEENK